MIMRVAYVLCIKPLCYLLSFNTRAIYAVLYSRHDMNPYIHYYFLPKNYQRGFVSYVF